MSTEPQRNIIHEMMSSLDAAATPAEPFPTARTQSSFVARPILVKPEQEELRLAFAQNLFDLFRAMTILPDAELEETPALCRHSAFPFNPMFKGTWQARLDAEVADAAIADTIAWFQAREGAVLLLVGGFRVAAHRSRAAAASARLRAVGGRCAGHGCPIGRPAL